ncbi:MAG: 6-phosphofructokinase, partial [Planctomycetaceae bacterium]
RVPHVPLNPLFTTIPELDPCLGGTILGASRTYIGRSDAQTLQAVADRLERLGIEGLICIGGDGTINGMQPITDFFPCVLAPKTIDNDLGLNYLDEPNEWVREDGPKGQPVYRREASARVELNLEEMINYATPGYATAVFVVAQSIQRIRTTAEGHRRIAIIEVMGRQSGYIALGSAYGQPDIILLPEVPLNLAALQQRTRELYDLQQHVVIVVGEGVTDEEGRPLGSLSKSVDPSETYTFSGASEELARLLSAEFSDEFFRSRGQEDSARSAIFTRKIGHTQRGGRPIKFDRFHAIQLGGQAVELLLSRQNNTVATLQYSQKDGFHLDSLGANKLRDRWRVIHPRCVHPSLYDPHRFQPSKLGLQYLLPIFTNAIGTDDVECMRSGLFHPGNLTSRYQSVNVDMQKRTQFLAD